MRYELEKKEHGGQIPGSSDQNDHSLKTAERIAKETGVSAPTIRRAAKFAAKVNKLEPEERKEVLSGKRKPKNTVAKKAVSKSKPKPMAVDQVNDEIKNTFEAFYEAVRKARKNHWKDAPRSAIQTMLESLEGLLI